MNEIPHYTPIEVAVALSLYAFNVSPAVRAQRIYDHFDGDCAELVDLVEICAREQGAFAATELAMPSAIVYVEHALLRYGYEARERIQANVSDEKCDMIRMRCQDSYLYHRRRNP